MRVRDRDETEMEKETDRETDRDRQTEQTRDRDRKTDRTDRNRDTDTDTDRQTDRQRERPKDESAGMGRRARIARRATTGLWLSTTAEHEIETETSREFLLVFTQLRRAEECLPKNV